MMAFLARSCVMYWSSVYERANSSSRDKLHGEKLCITFDRNW